MVVLSQKGEDDGSLHHIFDYSYGSEEERSTFDLNNSYIVLDTVHSINEIKQDSTYLFFHLYKGDKILSGKEAIDYYDTFFSPALKEKYSPQNHCLLLCSKYDLRKRIEADSEISKFLLTVPASNWDVADKTFFYVHGKPYIMIDYLQMCLKHQSKNLELWKQCLEIYLYLDTDNDRIEQIANKILKLEANSEDAYYALARVSANKKDWNNALKYSRLALDYGESEFLKANCHLIIAWVLYNTGDKEKAKEEYNLGYNDGYDLRDKYKECAGCPFEINDIRFEDEVVYVKLYDSYGNLQKSNSSPSGYTYSDEISCLFYDSQTINKTIELIGWGSSIKGNWEPGNYRIEIWYKGELLRGMTFRIY